MTKGNGSMKSPRRSGSFVLLIMTIIPRRRLQKKSAGGRIFGQTFHGESP